MIYSKLKQTTPLKKQMIKFVIIGVMAVIVDLCFYYIFLNILPEGSYFELGNEAVAKALSFLCGMVVTYTFNKFWTWKKKDRSNRRLVKFISLYGCSLIVNVAVNSGLLFILHEWEEFAILPYKYFIAFSGAVGVTALLNFLGQKYWVFKPSI